MHNNLRRWQLCAQCFEERDARHNLEKPSWRSPLEEIEYGEMVIDDRPWKNPWTEENTLCPGCEYYLEHLVLADSSVTEREDWSGFEVQ